MRLLRQSHGEVGGEMCGEMRRKLFEVGGATAFCGIETDGLAGSKGFGQADKGNYGALCVV
jgi:hypothetical protein